MEEILKAHRKTAGNLADSYTAKFSKAARPTNGRALPSDGGLSLEQLFPPLNSNQPRGFARFSLAQKNWKYKK
jgi:hypothetical protein